MQLRQDIQEAIQECEAVYPEAPEGRLTLEAYRIQFLTDSVKELVGKTVLDIGCGAKFDADTNYSLYERYFKKGARIRSYQFDPWYCRLLYVIGASPIGVDIADNSTEPFESHRIDITKKSSLRIFDDASIDFANNSFCTVPHNSRYAKAGTSPAIQANFYEGCSPDYRAVWQLNSHITDQIERVLKEGGLYTLVEFAYKKEGGQLKVLDAQKELI